MSINIYIENKAYSAKEGQTILDVLQDNGITSVTSPCGGAGKCGKCKVHVSSPEFTGNCLACQTLVTEGMVVSLKPAVKMEVKDSGKCYIWPADAGEDIGDSDCGIACDIGTTTVVCHLLKLKTGERLGTIGGANPQGVFGADVISRIQASVEGKTDKMTDAIVSFLNRFIADLCADAGIEISNVKYLAVAGNTVMSHLYAGLSPDSIGVAPFTPLSYFGDEIDAKSLGMIFDGNVYIVPCISGYVGGDITADILSTELYKSAAPTLLIDIGTNGEMVLGSRDKMVCCATAAGPAFEGAQIKFGMPASAGAINTVSVVNGKIAYTTIGNTQAVGICGSGLIDALAAMLNIGAVDESGRLLGKDELPDDVADYISTDEDGLVFCLTEDKSIYVTQGDIRKIQLAKAAIAAGVLVMIERSGIKLKDVSKLILAGGFGSYIDPKSAARIGLIPDKLLDVTEAVGNAAGEGAVSAAISEKSRSVLSNIKNDCEYIELSGLRSFNEAYVEAMMFD